MHMRLAALVALAWFLPLEVAAGEACAPGGGVLLVDGLGTWSEELARLAELAPGVLVPRSGMLRRGAVSERAMCAGASVPWGRLVGTDEPVFDWVAPRLTLAFERASPSGGNDGLLWQGKGASSLLSGGVRGRWKAFSYQLAPEVSWSQNAEFELVDTGLDGREAYASGFYRGGLDLPQRFGADPFFQVSPGQSYLQLEGFGARIGVSTENRWWGPGIRHAVLLTNNAPGFPHAYLGTARPVDIWIGALEAEWFVGSLTRSKYHLDPYATPAFTGLALVYQPRWVHGLYLGVGRTYVESWESLRDDWFLSVLEGPDKGLAGGDNPSDNQMLSAWFRWVMTDVELYGEFAQDDFHPNLVARTKEPDRCAAWNLGFQKRIASGDRWWRVVGELAKTASNRRGSRSCSVYLHGRNGDYTHEGQLLGDWIGPGADSQYLGVDVFTQGGRFGGFVERVRRNQEVYWQLGTPDEIKGRDDAELVLGLRHVLLLRAAELSWNLAAGRRFNRDFLQDEFVLRAGLSVMPVLPSRGASPRAE